MSPVTRMRGADAGFLYLETPAMHMHTLKIAVVDPTPDMTYENLVKAMLFRLRRMPALRRRVVPVPFALNHPVLVTQRRLDPHRHFHRHDVGGTGSMRDLERLIGEIASTPLDRSVPLWEIHLCEGLADGRVGIVGKIHHALADGAAANAMLANVMDVGSAELRPGFFSESAEGDEVPSRRRMVLEALRDAALQLLVIPGLLARTARALTGMLRYRHRESRGVPLPIKDAPPTSFNGPLTARRTFATATLPLADLKEVRRLHADSVAGLTLNDVVLAVTSGALRRWLDAHDEHPRASLTAGVPVAMDPRDSDPRLFGNNVSNMFTTLATDVDDPVERLRVISETARHAKAMNRHLGTSLADWSQFTPPAPVSALVRAYSRHRGARFHNAPFSAIVSNVPGPRERVKIGGAQLADVFSVGPLVEGIGLNVTVWSYVDRMNFSLLACPDLLPDVEVLASYLRPALAELLGKPEPGAAAEPVAGDNDANKDQESA
ncbi:wax ester/triacylglycerol synthase family O-acyltransferase [Nocardioides antri]|uniref:Diacylglycerol O-acyltransferase n=1 Tax=Nocardioides antri TaxID=2607659 RepID=A0A5B1M4S1_9ACTN|nr:wax ester/triacylglycerol synthase family O-acyltransferase [Nocardioides antri]KAA1427666.1 wax ester/triacylglycerol synthase family O-acyltransferase [Nocardioides antri]